MREVEPKVFLVASTSPDGDGLKGYLEHVGAPGWSSKATFMEILPEFMGRVCYRSFAPGLNPNVTKTRVGNDTYLANILRVGHGSVLEHSSASFVFANVSRVFTHELVRHRVGTAMSQESGRYIRLDRIDASVPKCFRDNPEALKLFRSTIEHLEDVQAKLTEIYDLNNPKMDFAQKKEITSAMRRLAPIGLATSIGWTANVRTLRQVIVARTSRHAEEEIRIVFNRVAEICRAKWPNLFQDFVPEEVNGINEWTVRRG